jgi:sterol desaturase/sphingolipid hydroxylase (fatty acid hydroxylase superfamily)
MRLEDMEVEPSSHTFIEALKYERKRYAKKGVVGIGFNLLFWPFFVVVCRDLLRAHWEWFMGLAEWRVLYTLTVAGINVVVTIVYNLVMWPIYTGKVTCFEQYRILDKDWHWETDLREFKRMLRDTWLRIAFNSLVLTPFFLWNGAPYSRMKRGLQDFDDGVTIFCQIWVLQAIESAGHGFFHCILHHPLFYNSCHKMHH